MVGVPPFEAVTGLPVLEQDFAKLEEAMESGDWEVDGDDLELYTCEESSAEQDGPPGAVFVTSGKGDGWSEVVHDLAGGVGARVCRLSGSLIGEQLDNGSSGSFTIGLAFDADTEESSLLALTLRRAREQPGQDEEGLVRAVELHFNGVVAASEVRLPVRLDFEADLCWDAAAPGGRRARLRHRLRPAPVTAAGILAGCSGNDRAVSSSVPPGCGAAADSNVDVAACHVSSNSQVAAAGARGAAANANVAPAEAAADVGGVGDFQETLAEFYTTSGTFDKAATLYLHSAGAVKIRLLKVSCFHIEPE